MRKVRKYRFLIEDESHLRTITEISASPRSILLWVGVVVLLLFILAGGIIMVTPLRRLLPGYLNNSERVATEENLLRLDSLQAAYLENQAFIDNFLRVADTGRQPTDSTAAAEQALQVAVDSLLPAGDRERKFLSAMEARERYNLSVLAPLDADGIMFSPASPDGTFTADSRESQTGVVIVPANSPVQAVADGNAVSVHYSVSDSGYEVILQHERGFLSSYSGVGKPLVAPGDAVTAGEAIAMTPAADRHGVRRLYLRMWHDALPIVPYEYTGSQITSAPATGYESRRGK